MMSKERTAAFTDAVLAIVMTILVLELQKPAEPTLAALFALRHDFFAYALSFFWLGSMWVHMHQEWDDALYVDTRVLWRVVLMLFFSSLIPYTTSLVSESFYNPLVQCLYGAVVIALTLSNVWLSRALAAANEGVEGMGRELMARRQRLLLVDCGIKAVGFVFAATLWPPAMMVSIGVAAAFIIAGVRTSGRRG